jgi:DNA-binding MarR family transcriptional regulator
VASGLTTAAVTAVIDRLERGDWARRIRDTEDRRKVIVEINSELIEREIVPLYRQLSKSMEEVTSRYNTDELDGIRQFFAESTELLVAETAALRAGEERAEGNKPGEESLTSQ